MSTTLSSFRTSDPTPVGFGSVVGTTNPTALTRGETVDEVVFVVGSDGSEVTTLGEVITRAAVVVSGPEVQRATSLGGDPFVVVTSGGEVFDVSTKIPNNNTVAVVVRSSLEVDGVEDILILVTVGTTSDGEDTIVAVPRR